MASLDKKFLLEALALPVDQRAELADKLLESLNGPIPEEIERAWAEEAERRVAEIKSGKVKPIPAEDVFKKIHDRFHP